MTRDLDKEQQKQMRKQLYRAIPKKKIDTTRKEMRVDGDDPDSVHKYLDELGLKGVLSVVSIGQPLWFIAKTLKVFDGHLNTWLIQPQNESAFDKARNFQLDLTAEGVVMNTMTNTDDSRETLALLDSQTKASKVAVSKTSKKVTNKMEFKDMNLIMQSNVAIADENFRVGGKKTPKVIEQD